MPKERRVQSLRFDRSSTSPYHYERKKWNDLVESIGDEKEWEEIRCPICIEPPHNAILLLCSSRDKGCRPYICDTNRHHSNCLEQFQKSFSSADSKLLCPLCRGQISGTIVVNPARKFMDSVLKGCSFENCEFSGTYSELEKHVGLEHPGRCPSEVDPVRQNEWMRLERERNLQDILLHNGSSGGMTLDMHVDDQVLAARLQTEPGEELDDSWHIYNEISIQNGSNGSGVSVQSLNRPRRTARMRAGRMIPGRQLASRTNVMPD